MYAIAVTKPGVVEVVELPEFDLGPYDVRIQSESGFICNATDRKVIEGHFPGLELESYPLLLGHETVGRVCEVGEKVRSFYMGDRVVGGLLLDPPGGVYGSGWGGDSEYVLARDHAAMVADGTADEAHGWNDSLQIMQKVPEDISLEAAGLLCTWREVYAGLFTDFKLKAGDDIMVYGAGPVGLSFIRFARISGFGSIISVDPLAVKREKALLLGADEAFSPDDPELKDLCSKRGKKFDAIIDAVGHNSIIQAALPMIRMGGSICVYGVLGSSEIRFQKETGPYNFNLLVHQWPTREAEAAALNPLLKWIREGLLDENNFVTGVYSAAEICQAVEETKQPHAIKTMIQFDRWT